MYYASNFTKLIDRSLLLLLPNCVGFNSISQHLEHPGSSTIREFHNAWLAAVDYGACCAITPHLNFINPKTNKLSPSEYKGEDWLDVPKGSQNGLKGGLKIMLDIEMFDYSFTGKQNSGFRIAFADPRDKALIKEDGYLISPGKSVYLNIQL